MDEAYFNRVRRNPTLTLQRIVAGCRQTSVKRMVAQAELDRRERMRKLWADLLGAFVRALAPLLAILRPFWPSGMSSGQ